MRPLLSTRQVLHCFGYLVGDHAFASNSAQFRNHLKQNLSANLDVRILGIWTYFVSWSITQSKRSIKITQSGYIEQILKYHGIKHQTQQNRYCIRLQIHYQLIRTKNYWMDHQRHMEYRTMIGIFLYLAVCNKNDLSFSVAVLARQVYTPIFGHPALVKWIMRYVAWSADVSLL